jgi:hypothetical protein
MSSSSSKPPEDQPLSSREEHKLLEMFRETFEKRHPNPDRVGCPGTEKLRALAFHEQLPEAEGVVTHITRCSPCYTEYSAFIKQRKLRHLLIPLTAAAILVLGCAIWLLRAPIPKVIAPVNPSVVKTPEPTLPVPAPPETQQSKPREFQVASLDLRNRGIARGGNSNQEEDLNLPIGRLKLTIYLPIGSEEGRYEIRITGRQGGTATTTTTHATTQNHLTVLNVSVDTSGFSPGKYNLAIRQAGSGWNKYPLKLK